MKFLKDKQTRHDFVTYAMCLVAFAIVFFMQSNHMIPRMIAGQLVPITAYIVMAISLNLVVGIAGDLSLGHAGFMSVGAYTGIVIAVALESAVPSDPMRLIISIVVGAIAAAILGFLIGIPVLRLSGDYLAIVTLAFGEIIKEIVTCLIVGVDSRGLHVIFNITGNSTIDDLHLLEDGTAIIKGAQGASGVSTYSTFLAGAILVMVALVIVLNLVRSRTGRAIMAVRDNKIAAESVGISVTQYRMMPSWFPLPSPVLPEPSSAVTSRSSPPLSSTSTRRFSFWCSWSWVAWATCAVPSSRRHCSRCFPSCSASSRTTVCSSTPLY